MKENEVTIKSVGYINGEYKVILSNDTELIGIQFMSIGKELNSIGQVKLEVALFDRPPKGKND